MTGGADIAVLKAVLDPSGIKQGAQDGSKALDQLSKSADDLDNVMEQVVGVSRKLLGVLGIYKFAEWIKGAVDLAARYTTLGVVLTQVGKSAGYSSNQITALTKVLEKQGISMLQARQTVISMIQAKLDLAKADELAAVAQDAAVTAGLNSSETLQRIVFGITSSQQEVLRTVGITVQFDEAYRNLSRTLNKSVSDLTSSEKAQARVNAVLDAAKPIAGAYGASMETAGKQVKSMERYVEDLQVKIGQAFQPAYTVLIFSLANAVKFLGENANVLLAVIGAAVVRGLLAFITSINAARASLIDKIRVMGAANNAAIQQAKSEGVLTEATVAAARAARAKMQADMAALAVTKEAIVQQRALYLERLREANIRLSGARVGAGFTPVEAAATRQVASSQISAATTQLAVLGQQQERVQGQINKTTVAMTGLDKATALSTRAVSGFTAAINMMGGALGLALISIGAFYMVYAAEMQKAKDQVDTNAEAIKKKLKEIEDARNRPKVGLVASTVDETANFKYLKSVRDMADGVELAKERISSYSVSIGDQLKGLLVGGFGEFNNQMELLSQQVKSGMGAEDAARVLDALEMRYPKMASSVQKAREQVALFSIKQDELNKFLKDNESPLMKAVMSVDSFTRAFRGLNAEVKPPEFYTPELGDQGKAIQREISNQIALQNAIRTGSKERVRALQDQQSAEEKANAIVTERVRGNEKLQAVTGKTFMQLQAMGPVRDNEIRQLIVDSKAVYDLEQRKSSLIRTTERLQGAEEKAYAMAKERKQFLDGFQNTDTAQKQLDDKLNDYSRTRRLGGASPASIESDVSEARLRDARVRLTAVTEKLYESENKRKEAQAEELKLQRMGTDATTVQIETMKRANAQISDQIAAIQKSKKSYEDFTLQQRINNVVRAEEARLNAVGLTLSPAKAQAMGDEIVQQERLNKVLSAYIDLIASPNFKAESIADAGVVFGAAAAAKSTSNWAEALQQVNSAMMLLGNTLDGSNEKSDRAAKAAVQAVSVITAGLQVAIAMQKQAEAAQQRAEAAKAGKGQGSVLPGGLGGGALGVVAVGAASFGAGYAAGGTTTNKLAGAGKGLLAGVGSGAATGAAIASFGGPIGAGVGAIVGGIVGLVGGILGSAKAGKQAAAQALQAQAQIQQSMAALRMTFADDQLGAALENVKSQFNDVRKGIEAAYSGKKKEAERNQLLQETNVLEQQRLAILKAEYALGQTRIQQDNRILLLRAQGRDAEADQMSFAVQQERELYDARKAGYDATTLAAIAERQKAEAVKFAADVAKQEAAKVETKRRTGFDMINTINSYSDPRGAAQAAFEETQRRRITDAMAEEATALELATIQLFNFAEEVERNRQIQEQDKRTGESLVGRILGSMSDKRRTEDFGRSVANRQELADAAGQPSYITDFIKFAQFAEASAVQMQRAIEDQTKVIRDKADGQIKALNELNDATQKDAQKQIDLIDASIKSQQERHAAVEKSTTEAINRINAATAVQIEKYDRYIANQQTQLEYASRHLQIADAQYQVAKQAYDALYGFSRSFNSSDMSSMNALDKRADLARLLEEAFAGGRNGDAGAAANVPAIAQALLASSRNVFSIGDGYKADEARVKEITGTLLNQYGGAFSQTGSARESAAASVEMMQQQIEGLQLARQAIVDQGAADVKIQENIRDSSRESANAAIDLLELERNRIGKSASDYATETQKQIDAISAAAQKQIDEVVRIETLNNDMRIKTSSFYAAVEAFIRDGGFPASSTSVSIAPVPVAASTSAPSAYEQESLAFMRDSLKAKDEELFLLRGVLATNQAGPPAIVQAIGGVEAGLRALAESSNRSSRRARANSGV